ncbi:unnamed protein product [Rotaria socialis]|uniref:Peptidase C1A papain C-terminal domain-containing protein n=1 Tax=Rotaria socialis TaxID=392032 RepID=A0A818K1D5_9BILA|nr:unnamed protein product [Rotaria socialis]CAF4815640.1 unnamed protein product [Rotaria socialis]
MTLKSYLANKLSGKKYRINSLRRSDRLPSKDNLRQLFHDHMIYSADQLPSSVDLRSDMTPVEDQSQIGSCDHKSFIWPNLFFTGAYEYITKKSDGNDIAVSRLFIYYNGHAKANPATITDSGCTMTDGIEGLEEFGVRLESVWPYDISQVNTKPSEEAYQDAAGHTITDALQVGINLNEMKSCLAQGLPFAFGLVLFKLFAKASANGIVPYPGLTDIIQRSIGGHALLAVGYSDTSNSFIVRNSWGEDWGDKGYCYIPYKYMTHAEYCFDAWTIRKLATDDLSQGNGNNDDSMNYHPANSSEENNDEDDDTHTP